MSGHRSSLNRTTVRQVVFDLMGEPVFQLAAEWFLRPIDDVLVIGTDVEVVVLKAAAAPPPSKTLAGPVQQLLLPV